MTNGRSPKDSDMFMVDTDMGQYYHVPGCVAVSNRPAVYELLSYSEIRKLVGHSGYTYQMHDCVMEEPQRRRKGNYDR